MIPDDLPEHLLQTIACANAEGELHQHANEVVFMLRSLGASMDMDSLDEESFTMTLNMGQFMALIALFSLGVEMYNRMEWEEE